MPTERMHHIIFYVVLYMRMKDKLSEMHCTWFLLQLTLSCMVVMMLIMTQIRVIFGNVSKFNKRFVFVLAWAATLDYIV